MEPGGSATAHLAGLLPTSWNYMPYSSYSTDAGAKTLGAAHPASLQLPWLFQSSLPLRDVAQLQLLVEGLDVCMHLLARGQGGAPRQHARDPLCLQIVECALVPPDDA